MCDREVCVRMCVWERDKRSGMFVSVCINLLKYVNNLFTVLAGVLCILHPVIVITFITCFGSCCMCFCPFLHYMTMPVFLSVHIHNNLVYCLG